MNEISEVNGRILASTSQGLFLSKGHRILRSVDFGVTWQTFITLPASIITGSLMKSVLASRLLRKEINHLVFGKGSVYVFANRSVFIYRTSPDILPIMEGQIYLGYRPLCVAFDGTAVWFGEYIRNPERRPIKLFRLKGCELLENATLEDVRHIHGVFWDDFAKKIWITTGDRDSESIIWELTKEGPRAVLGGAQRYRAVTLLFDESSIYFGTDTPLEQNAISRIDREDLSVSKCCNVGSSVFYGAKAGNKFLFATVIEPSDVNPTRVAEIWFGSEDNWRCLATEKKDFLSMKLFQYGQFHVVANPDRPLEVWVYSKALKSSGVSRKVLLDQ
jgi:hypothetical protein